MSVCNVDYCDFCACTFSTQKEGDFSLYIKHIYIKMINFEIIACVTKSKHFLTVCLLPEILENWYTRPAVTSADIYDNA